LDIASLNKRYGIIGKLEFTSGQGGLPVAIITNEFAKASVAIYGAHVLGYCPKGQEEVLWMSSLSTFEEGSPIRGGIPVCFPWFGPHDSDSKKPQHGFARLQMWKVAETASLQGGETRLRLILRQNSKIKTLWQYSFLAEMIITVGASLTVTFRCTNTGEEQFTYTDALHSYFGVSDIANVKIKGLSGSRYYDGMKATVPVTQKEDSLEIQKEENRRYIDTTNVCMIEDSGLSRKIRVGKTGSRVTVVWNPWAEMAKKIADMPDDGYKTMVCVEAVNAYNDIAVVQPKESCDLSTSIAVEAY
jgi:glucose-6-phosphate 1-epimerase